MNATLYRDAEYGALGVHRGAKAPGVVTIDHGFMAEDFDAVLALLERYSLGAPIDLGDGARHWNVKVHETQAITALDAVLRQRGYRDDPLGERAILSVGEPGARSPDLPTSQRAVLTETAERGHRAFISEVLVALGDPTAKFAEAYFARTLSAGALKRPLPFLRARALVKGSDPQLAERLVREALARVEGGLRRATARKVAEGRLLVEFALALPIAVLESFEQELLPAFQPATAGYREVRFAVSTPLAEGKLLEFAKRGGAAGALVGKLQVNSRVLVARVPSAHAGSHVTDLPLAERIGWLARELEGHAALAEISDLRDVNGVPIADADTIAEMSPWPQIAKPLEKLVAKHHGRVLSHQSGALGARFLVPTDAAAFAAAVPSAAYGAVVLVGEKNPLDIGVFEPSMVPRSGKYIAESALASSDT